MIPIPSYSFEPMAADRLKELEAFRLQWRLEVEARSAAAPSASKQTRNVDRGDNSRHDRGFSPQLSEPTSRAQDVEDSSPRYEHNNPRALDDLNPGDGCHPADPEHPASALEHYERAVEREGEGSLGDSLQHYRTAYKLDAGVEQLYRQKHFPPSTFPPIPQDPNPSIAAVTVPNTAHHSLDGPVTPSICDIISSFQSSSITGKESPTSDSTALPCPIAQVPSEIVIKILYYTALSDPASFARLAQICRRLAFLVSTEDRIWRAVCMSDIVGFGAMHYCWALTLTGLPLPISIAELDDKFSALSPGPTPRSLPLSSVYPSHQHMFHERPRIRFNGCYISTVNYIRPGAATASRVTWTSPVLIVTYYRYLRFFRDGTCVSLLTTSEPADVVHHLTKENMHTHHTGGLPSAVMNQALRGRWKLKGNPFGVDKYGGEEGTLDIETEGADADRPQPKYIYKLGLQMKSVRKAPSATRNNKLVWLGYWSYNKLTDDWCEFGLKNDRAFFWSRVKSYSDGEG